MPTIALPIVFNTVEDDNFKQDLESKTLSSKMNPATADILLKYPIVYIHYWIDHTETYESGVKLNKYGIYVGESNNVIQRTKQHYEEGVNINNWQYKLVNAQKPEIIVIGHEHFNKSMTLDIENKLYEYILAMDSIERIYNGRGNPQNDYYPCQEFETIFNKIWRKLNHVKSDLFLSESVIMNNSIFKASPFKKLTDDQIIAKDAIFKTIRKALNEDVPNQLIFVHGGAGTGKTVLTANIFFELAQKVNETDEDFYGRSFHLMVNQKEQLRVYEQIAKRLDLGDDVVSLSTTFIHNHDEDNKVDIAFIDEGHLLYTMPNQGYSGDDQLSDIMARSKVTVIMFDECQMLTTQNYWEQETISELISLSQEQGNYIVLKNQLRMHCSQSTKDWLNAFIYDDIINRFKPDSNNYEVKSFDSPKKLEEAIKAKAKQPDTSLSRLVATYDWDYKENKRPVDGGQWGVKIGRWFKPWNYELAKGMTRKQKRTITNLAWAEQPQTIDEIGSTFTIHGFDLSYVGVILGPSVKFRDGKIVFDPSESKNGKAIRNRKLKDGTKKKFGEQLKRNEVNILMLRGVSGLYIYACDKELRKALKNIAKI